MKISKEMISLAETVMQAMALEGTVREVVQSYQCAILQAHRWPPSAEFANYPSIPKVILEPKHTYLLDQEHATEYSAQCDSARKAAGLGVIKEGNCPLLEAESMRFRAENALLAEVSKLPGLGRIDASRHVMSLEQRKQALDLTLRLTAPFVRDAREQIERIMRNAASAHA